MPLKNDAKETEKKSCQLEKENNLYENVEIPLDTIRFESIRIKYISK